MVCSWICNLWYFLVSYSAWLAERSATPSFVTLGISLSCPVEMLPIQFQLLQSLRLTNWGIWSVTASPSHGEAALYMQPLAQCCTLIVSQGALFVLVLFWRERCSGVVLNGCRLSSDCFHRRHFKTFYLLHNCVCLKPTLLSNILSFNRFRKTTNMLIIWKEK